MISQKYELKEACFGILSEPDGKRFSVFIPAGAMVVIVDGPLDGVRMVEIEWDGKTVLLFTEDLRKNGILVETFSATPETEAEAATKH